MSTLLYKSSQFRFNSLQSSKNIYKCILEQGTEEVLSRRRDDNMNTAQGKAPAIPMWSLGVTWGWVRVVSEAGCARVGVN